MEILNPIASYLDSITTLDLTPDVQKLGRTVIAIRSTDTLESAVQLLIENRFQCAPVIDESIPQVVGLFGLEDVATYLAEQMLVMEPTLKDRTMKGFVGKSNQITVSSVVDLSGRNPMQMISQLETGFLAAELLAGGLHRLIVLDEAKCVRAMVTQSDICRSLYNNIHQIDLSPMMNSSLANLGVKLKPIRSVNEKDSIQAVLQIFREFGGVCAVLNANGDLAGHFSPSDFRGLFDDNSCPLNASLFDFLSRFSPGSLKPQTITFSVTLGDCIRQFCEKKIHHLWIVKDKKPVGCFSLTDLLSVVVSTKA